MDAIIRWFQMRPLRFIGGFIVFISTGLLFFLVMLNIIAGPSNPYLGILTYMILPIILIIGLLLVPLDSWIQRRRAARGEPAYPVINLCDAGQRRIAAFFVVASIVILVVMTVASYKAIEFMDTKTFCGKVCHRVMIPEYTAYVRSPHASVACIECHIGPGAPWFVRSKLSGIPQIWHYTIGDYPRPIPTPVKALRPSRDTCENCHWPEQFYGDTLRTTISYKQDKQNTRDYRTMLMHVGSGGVLGAGIHSHIVNKITYLPAVENRSEIAWLRIERKDGSTEEFVNPSYSDQLSKIRKTRQTRLMDCIDCHNRPAHDFESYETLLDLAITNHQIDTSLPFIKKEAMDAAGQLATDGSDAKAPTRSQQNEGVNKIHAITAYYKKQFPDIYRTRRKDIESSVKAIENVYLGAAFPHMRVGPGTYPNWKTHTGCFRCHGVLIAAKPGGRIPAVPFDCTLCHTEQKSEAPTALLGTSTP